MVHVDSEAIGMRRQREKGRPGRAVCHGGAAQAWRGAERRWVGAQSAVVVDCEHSNQSHGGTGHPLSKPAKRTGHGFAKKAWDPVSAPTPARHPTAYKTLLKKHLCVCFRIAGDTALSKNIHESVSAQIRKNFAKSKWRVSPYFPHPQ